MVQSREVVLVCDLCGSENMVDTHRISVDGTARDAEACEPCWSKTLASFATWATAGRAPTVKRSKTGDLLQWPDTPWRFTAHAFKRMGERHVKPHEVLAVIERPEIKRPGEAADEEIWQRGETKVVVIPSRQVIKTVAKIQTAPALAKAV